MASPVQICNAALSHLGSEARVASISPPDGSVEASYCDTFFAVARKEFLEPGNWPFAVKRVALAIDATAYASEGWYYAYAIPSDCLRALRILKTGGTDDNDGAEFEREGDILYTQEADAVLVYVRDVTDTNKWPPSFVTAFSYVLASYLAGPIIKGMEGVKVGDSMRARALQLAEASAVASANATREEHTPTPSIVAARS